MVLKKYKCTKCGINHIRGKIYKKHLKYRQEEDTSEREFLLLKLAKLNRLLSFGSWNGKYYKLKKDDKKYIKKLRLGLKRKIEND